MSIRTELLALSALTIALTAPAAAQGVSINLAPSSKVIVAGGSNVHEWSCSSSAFEATVELDSAYRTSPMTELRRPIRKASVTIPVTSLKCGKSKMDDNMYKALNAEKYPQITFVLSTYDIDQSLTTRDAFTAKTIGELTVAGTTARVEMPLSVMRNASGVMTGDGRLQMKMTDVGIKPPVALLGTLRTKNEIEITFHVVLDRSQVVAATRE